MTKPKDHFTKEFLDKLDVAIVESASMGKQCTLLFKRNGMLDVRVKIDLIPPIVTPPVYVFVAPT